MSSDVEKIPGSETASQEKKVFKKKEGGAKAKKPHKSLGWFIGVVILLLISITFILPTTIFTNTEEVVFGRYDGTKIKLAYDTFFYYQLQQISAYYAEQYGGSLPVTAYMEIYYQAFQNSIVYQALSDMAEKAKIEPSENYITQSVIEYGYWNDENGEFDTERYNSATDTEKAEARKMVELAIPYAMVATDIQGAKISSAESDFIQSISNTGAKSFSYMVVNSDQYGDAEAVAYMNNNPEPFMQIGLTSKTYTTKDEADAALASFVAGTAEFDGESMGLVFKYQLDSTLASSGVEAASDTVFSTETGSFAGPYSTGSGYILYRVDSAPQIANTEADGVLSSIKAYIASNDSAILLPYIAGVATDVQALAKEDIDEAISKYSLPYYTVDNVSMNTGNSELVYSVSSADVSGYLITAITSDPEYERTLFSSETGTVLDPVLSGSSYIVTVVEDATENDTYSEYIKNMIPIMYDSYASQFTLMDLQNSVLTSDKVEDNFFDTYATKILGSGSSAQ